MRRHKRTSQDQVGRIETLLQIGSHYHRAPHAPAAMPRCPRIKTFTLHPITEIKPTQDLDPVRWNERQCRTPRARSSTLAPAPAEHRRAKAIPKADLLASRWHGLSSRA